MDKKQNKSIIVFYHAGCVDGFTAAWVAYKKFGNKAEYIAQFHDDDPQNVTNREVYTLDMTFPKQITERLMRDNKRVTSIDHHISTKEITLSTHQPLFALNHSGCVLAWQYFFPNKPMPKFLSYVEDHDIYIKKLRSGAFYCYLDLFDHAFSTWNKIVNSFENVSKRKMILEKGDFIRKHQDRVIDRMVSQNAKLVKFEGYTIYCVNSNDTPSEIGRRLIKRKPPFVIVWSEDKNGIIHVSLRGEGNIDCSKIAQKYGGGGHKLASAFRLKSLLDIPWEPVSVER